MTDTEIKRRIEQTLADERDKLFQYASYRFIDIADVEDVLQDLYVLLLSRTEALSGVSNLKGYIYRALSNSCNSRLRSMQKREICMADISQLDIADLSPASFDEEFRIINVLLSRLPAEQSETIRLRLHCDLTFEQIAEITEVPLPTAKSRFRYGIDRLRRDLKKYDLF